MGQSVEGVVQTLLVAHHEVHSDSQHDVCFQRRHPGLFLCCTNNAEPSKCAMGGAGLYGKRHPLSGDQVLVMSLITTLPTCLDLFHGFLL